MRKRKIKKKKAKKFKKNYCLVRGLVLFSEDR